MNYACHLLIYLSVYAIVAMSLNVIVGYCGILSLAHAGYFALGAYAYAITTTTLHWEFLPALVCAIFITAGLSLAVSLPAWRLRGDFFVMVSLAVQALIFNMIANWGDSAAPFGSWANLTGGTFGVPNIPRPVIFGIKFDTSGLMAALSITTALVCGILVRSLLSSPWGRALRAMRDDEVALRSLGKNVRMLKVQAFAFSCGLAGVGGTIYCSYVSYIDPSVAALDHSILLLAMVVVGGTGNFRGPLVGAALLLAIPEVLRAVAFPSQLAAEIRLLVYGMLLVAVMHWRHRGLAGSYELT